MTIFESFSHYSLNKGQQELLDNLNTFLEDDNSCFLLKGYAGTGKTFMMKGLTDFLTSVGRPFVLAAPTGRAAKVISKRTKNKAYTIHKTIYSNKDIEEFKTENINGTETFKFYYTLRNNQDQINTIYIIDEASMLSDMYSEGEFFRFGSGYLLKDLIDYVRFNTNGPSRKIIFIGDNAQLPPVNMNFSPALDESYIQDKYQVALKSYELTEVVRQQKESGILFNATRIRTALKDNIYRQISIDTNFDDTKSIQHNNLLENYLNACNNKIDEDTIIIAYSNASVKEYNDFVRRYFFPNQSNVTENDRIILVSNNYNYEIELLNGDFGVIKNVDSNKETRIITLSRKNKQGEVEDTKVRLDFRDVIIQFKDAQGVSYDISCKIVENILYSKERDLSSDEIKALYVDFKTRNSSLRAGSKELKDALRSDKYFNALRVKFGYAVTCHKAQGGEWERAFINCKTSMGYFNASYFRWLYTALTRAKGNLYTLDSPHFNVVENLTPPKTENFLETTQNIVLLKPEMLDIELPFNFANIEDGLRNIYIVISDLIKDDGIVISKIENNAYHEIYYFKRGDESSKLKIYYKRDFKVSSIQCINEGDLSNLLLNKIKFIEDKVIIVEEIANTLIQKEFSFQEDSPHLKSFFDQIRLKVTPFNIEIADIEHKPYHEIYKFQKGGLVAFYKFWYNGKGEFNKTEIIVNRTTGLTSEINSILK